MAAEALGSLFSLLVEYDESDRRHILSFICKILGKIETPKCRSISRNRLQKKTKHSELIFKILHIAGWRDNEAKTRITLSDTVIPTAQNIFRQISLLEMKLKITEYISTTTTNVSNATNPHQHLAFEETKSPESLHLSQAVTSDIQTLINMGFSKDQSVPALQAAAENRVILMEYTTQKCCVEQCPSVAKIANQLNMYKGYLNAHVSAEVVPLLNDFDHLLLHHDNDDDFEYVYNKLNKCQIKDCLISKRHHRDRSIETTQMSRMPLSHDTMD
eukprot:296620_1